MSRDRPAGPETQPAPTSEQKAETVTEKWGIEVVGIHLSAAGYMTDFRYRVVAPEKAAAILKRDTKTYLIDQKTGAKLLVPSSPKVGPMRQITRKPTAGRVYYVLFANPGHLIRAGNKVTIVIGDCRLEDLVVQ
jgi:hypothetical protein